MQSPCYSVSSSKIANIASILQSPKPFGILQSSQPHPSSSCVQKCKNKLSVGLVASANRVSKHQRCLVTIPNPFDQHKITLLGDTIWKPALIMFILGRFEDTPFISRHGKYWEPPFWDKYSSPLLARIWPGICHLIKMPEFNTRCIFTIKFSDQ